MLKPKLGNSITWIVIQLPKKMPFSSLCFTCDHNSYENIPGQWNVEDQNGIINYGPSFSKQICDGFYNF